MAIQQISIRWYMKSKQNIMFLARWHFFALRHCFFYSSHFLPSTMNELLKLTATKDYNT